MEIEFKDEGEREMDSNALGLGLTRKFCTSNASHGDAGWMVEIH